MVNITIDNHTIAVPSGTTIMEAAASIHIPIPKLCYLKDINENENLSQKQKRGRYCWKIFKAEEELKNMETAAQESKESLPAAIAGCIVLVIGAVAVKVWMKKEGK